MGSCLSIPDKKYVLGFWHSNFTDVINKEISKQTKPLMDVQLFENKFQAPPI